MTDAERRRAEFVAAACSALRYLREVQWGASRRARDLQRLGVLGNDPRALAGEFLSCMVHGLDSLADGALAALRQVEGASLTEVAERLDDKASAAFGSRRHRAELLADLSGAEIYLAETRAASLRRATDMDRMLATVRHPRHLRAFLRVTQRNFLLVAEAAEGALAGFDDVSVPELVGEIVDR